MGPLTLNLISTLPCIRLMLPSTHGFPPAYHLTSETMGSPSREWTAGESLTSSKADLNALDDARSSFIAYNVKAVQLVSARKIAARTTGRLDGMSGSSRSGGGVGGLVAALLRIEELNVLQEGLIDG